MITFLCILFILIAVLLIIGIVSEKEEPNFESFCRVCGGGMAATILMILGVGMLITGDYPRAIDVYRGKTELQIEKKIVNDKVVSSDSIVVWKK